jgi:pimeloyl-ACP methyl ester carboxylesterase
MFNILNPAALRDNVRQAALEQALLAHVLEHLTLDVSSCAGASPTARFDPQHLALMGHSMGATIAPLTLAEEPLYGATILSGAGGSYIENVLHKRKPLEVKPLAEIMLGYEAGTLRRHDPVLTLVQWAAEPADTQVYARRILAEPRPGEHPRHVLMLQGIVDHYILPRIGNTLSLSLGLDLAGVLRDEDHPDMPPDQIPLAQWLPWAGRTTRSLPVQGNLSLGGDAVTAVVTQHLQDGFEDGHEVAFQTAPAKAQYRCFLRTWRAGVPMVDEACGE